VIDISVLKVAHIPTALLLRVAGRGILGVNPSMMQQQGEPEAEKQNRDYCCWFHDDLGCTRK
jgi:hypothetical protein